MADLGSRFEDRIARFAHEFATLQNVIEKVIMGQEQAIRLALVCLFAQGHLLMEGVPGVGKTSLAQSIAATVGASYRRIQFTSDLLPTDITGASVYNEKLGDFQFRAGPVFANIVLCDEINRASPKAQSALLEVMEEGRITDDGKPHPVPQPFMVMATQNPIDFEGTYPLPEAQLDRFLLRLQIGYPDVDTEAALLQSESHGLTTPNDLEPQMSTTKLAELAHDARQVGVRDSVSKYIVELVSTTRGNARRIRLGASPRASLALLRTSRVYAASRGSAWVEPTHVQDVAGAVLSHRILLSDEEDLKGTRAENVIDDIVKTTRVPRP